MIKAIDFNKIPLPELYFSEQNGPSNWSSLEEFVKWYFDQRMPLMIPYNAPVLVTDNATSICIFKRKRFQVELYLAHPGLPIDAHSHPGVETILVPLGTGIEMMGTTKNGLSPAWGNSTGKVVDLEEHGGGRPKELTEMSVGHGLMAFEYWSEGLEMTSDAVRWKGKTAGPLHEALIKKYYPDAYVVPGFADVTKTKEDK